MLATKNEPDMTPQLMHDDGPPAVQAVDRDERGRFAPGNDIGNRFTPGTSGNPSGRPAGVAYPGDFLRGLSGLTVPALRTVTDDDNEPAVKRAAALQLLDALDGEMIALEGSFYQVKADGRAYEIDKRTRTPFAVAVASTCASEM